MSDADGASDIDRVEFVIAGSVVATVSEAPYTYYWDTYDNQVGSITVEVIGYDQSGAKRSDFVNLTLEDPDNYFPRPNLSNPTDGSTFSQGAIITFSATVTDDEGDGLAAVSFYVNGGFVGEDLDFTSPFQLDYDTSGLGFGDHSFEVRVFDHNGIYQGEASFDSATVTIQ